MKRLLPKSIRAKVALPLLLVGFLSGLAMGFSEYRKYIEFTSRSAQERMKFAIAFSKASRTYIKEVLRPRIDQLLAAGCTQEDFILEAQSSSFFTASIIKIVNEELPDLKLRQVAFNPLNPKNTPDEVEAKIITFLRQNFAKEYAGIVDYKGEKHFVYASAVVVEKGCLKCHYSVESMPKAVQALYKPSQNPAWEVGKIQGAVFVFMPFEKIILKAKLEALYQALIVLGIFVGITLALLLALERLVFKPLEVLQNRAEEIAKGNVDEPIQIDREDEIGKLAEAFERMRVSIKKVMDLLK